MNKKNAINEVTKLLAESNDSSINFIQELKSYKYIAVYGAGNLGKHVLQILKSKNLIPFCFLDKNATDGQTLDEISVYKADSKSLTNEFKEHAIVLISVYLSKSDTETITRDLINMGYKTVVNGYSLVSLSLFDFDNEKHKTYMNQGDIILLALDLMDDDHSRDIFCSSLRSHILREYDDSLISKDMTQYFDVNVPFKKGYHTFIDCGAFIGDSLLEMLKFHECNTYIGFEPDRKTFERLSATVESVKDKLAQVYLYPTATGESNAFVSFAAEGQGSSKITETGDQTVQVVKLDGVLKKIKPTMLKMDVEGFEIATLNGAKNLIMEHKPDLAVCVYHKVSDLWVIPLMLRKWVPEYKFYLRCHHFKTIETVLYATI